jgi:hypothetical protein
MPAEVDLPRFMEAVGVRNLASSCFDGWITVDRWCGDSTFCRLQLDKALPFVWAGWLLPVYRPDGRLSHLSWRGPAEAAQRLGLNFAHAPGVHAIRSGLMSAR